MKGPTLGRGVGSSGADVRLDDILLGSVILGILAILASLALLTTSNSTHIVIVFTVGVALIGVPMVIAMTQRV